MWVRMKLGWSRVERKMPSLVRGRKAGENVEWIALNFF